MTKNLKFKTHIAIETSTGKILYVTDTQGSMCYWEKGKPAIELSERLAKDIVYGLTVNGYQAHVIKTLCKCENE